MYSLNCLNLWAAGRRKREELRKESDIMLCHSLDFIKFNDNDLIKIKGCLMEVICGCSYLYLYDMYRRENGDKE